MKSNRLVRKTPRMLSERIAKINLDTIRKLDAVDKLPGIFGWGKKRALKKKIKADAEFCTKCVSQNNCGSTACRRTCSMYC